MDYTIQTEKIFKFLEFNTELHEAKAILKLKKIFSTLFMFNDTCIGFKSYRLYF